MTGNVNISIILTAYNYEDYVAECIDSCLEQTLSKTNYEIILVDDGSSDKTIDIAKSYGNKISIITTENCGVEKASNLGIKHANGDYVVRVDADDLLLPDYLETMLAAMDEDNSISFAYPKYYVIDAAGSLTRKVTLPPFDTKEIFQRGDFLATGTLYKVSAIEDVGLYSTQVKNCGLENYELILKLINNYHTGKYVDSFLFKYRHHGGNMSSIRRTSIINYGHKLAKDFALESYQTNDNHPYGLKI